MKVDSFLLRSPSPPLMTVKNGKDLLQMMYAESAVRLRNHPFIQYLKYSSLLFAARWTGHFQPRISMNKRTQRACSCLCDSPAGRRALDTGLHLELWIPIVKAKVEQVVRDVAMEHFLHPRPLHFGASLCGNDKDVITEEEWQRLRTKLLVDLAEGGHACCLPFIA